MAAPDSRVSLGPDNARMLIRTGREGFAARAGHDLTIEVTRWSAEVDLPGGDLAGATVTAEVHLDSLAVREGTGGAKPLTDDDRREITTTARRLLTERGPAVASFTSSRVAPAGRGGAIDGQVTLHGTTEAVRLQVTERGTGQYLASTALRQSVFGVRPYSAFLGALKLRDEVSVEISFELPGPAAAGPPSG
jgi:polyisoprenoid-binding protein YceI